MVHRSVTRELQATSARSHASGGCHHAPTDFTWQALPPAPNGVWVDKEREEDTVPVHISPIRFLQGLSRG